MRVSTIVLFNCFLWITQIDSKPNAAVSTQQLTAKSRKCLCNCCYDPRYTTCTPKLIGIIYYENNTFCTDIDCEIRCSKQYITCDTSKRYHINEGKCDASTLQGIKLFLLLFSTLFVRHFFVGNL